MDIFDPSKGPLLLFNPECSYAAHDFVQLQERVEKADAYVLATPDYHGGISKHLKKLSRPLLAGVYGQTVRSGSLLPRERPHCYRSASNSRAPMLFLNTALRLSFASSTDLKDGILLMQLSTSGSRCSSTISKSIG